MLMEQGFSLKEATLSAKFKFLLMDLLRLKTMFFQQLVN
jgi:hypothetical protein